jgi:hypothetical protein
VSKQVFRRAGEDTKPIKNSGVDFLQQELLGGISYRNQIRCSEIGLVLKEYR